MGLLHSRCTRALTFETLCQDTDAELAASRDAQRAAEAQLEAVTAEFARYKVTAEFAR